MIPRAFLRSTGVVRSGVRAHPRQTSRLLNSWPLERQPGPRRQSLISRYYSVASDATQATVGDTPLTDARRTGDDQEGDALEKQLEEKNKEVIALKDKYLRSVADFRNLQDRTKRDVQSAKDFAIQRFAKDLIESIDNLDRALDTAPKEVIEAQADEADSTNKDFLNLYNGLKMTETILMATLHKHGLQRFDPAVEGEKFNPNLHEATFHTPVEGKDNGEVVMTQQKGFLLNGRVLRAAKVGVVKNS